MVKLKLVLPCRDFLQEALGLFSEQKHVNSDELQALVSLAEFLIRLRLAIIANKWFDDGDEKVTNLHFI